MVASSPTTGRKSLLDVVQQKQSDEVYKTPTVSRCMYVARRAGETIALPEIAAIHKEPLELCCEEGGYAGLLILFPKCLLHILEVDSKKLVPVLHALHLAGGTAQLQDIKVISNTDNVPFQLFSQWQVTNISCDCKDQHEGVDSSLLVQTASALNIGCVQMAKKLKSLGQKQSSAEISSQQAALLSSLATPETILALTYTEALPTLQEYLHLFDGAISSTLDSERTWPPTRTLTLTVMPYTAHSTVF